MGPKRGGKQTANDLEQEQYDNAVILQCFVRCCMANITVKNKARRTWKRVYDPAFDVYFWYNTLNGESQWHVPKYMTLFMDRDHKAAVEFERITRGFLGRRKVKRLADSKWTRFFDATQMRGNLVF